MLRLLKGRWTVVTAAGVLLAIAFVAGLAGQVPLGSRRPSEVILGPNLLSRKLFPLNTNATTQYCSSAGVISATASGNAMLSKPNELETLFSVVPQGGRPSAADRACSVVTVLSIVRDRGSWGENDRTFEDYLKVLDDLMDEGVTLDLALSVESETEFKSIACTVIDLYKLNAPAELSCISSPHHIERPVPLSGIQIFHVPTLHGDPHPSQLKDVPRDERGTHPAQKARRRWLARNRNRLAWGAAKDQAAFLWLDTDLDRVPSGMLASMLASGKDIIVPVVRCTCSWGTDYFDKNTWIGPIQPGFSEAERQRFRTADDSWPGFKALHEWGGRWGPQLHYLDHPQYEDKDLVHVDAVGGAVLFVRPYVFQQGANFGIANMVGTDWESEGWDAIETEALCWTATKAGFTCWGMPRQVAWHVPCKY